MGFFFENSVVNNFISSWVGVTFVFIFATRKIFANDSRIPLRTKYVIYLVYQLILILLIPKLLGAIDSFIAVHATIGIIVKLSSILAKIIVTPITMTLNFFVIKGGIKKL